MRARSAAAVRPAHLASASLLAPVQTTFPDANTSAVVFGSRMRMMTAEKRCSSWWRPCQAAARGGAAPPRQYPRIVLGVACTQANLAQVERAADVRGDDDVPDAARARAREHQRRVRSRAPVPGTHWTTGTIPENGRFGSPAPATAAASGTAVVGVARPALAMCEQTAPPKGAVEQQRTVDSARRRRHGRSSNGRNSKKKRKKKTANSRRRATSRHRRRRARARERPTDRPETCVCLRLCACRRAVHRARRRRRRRWRPVCRAQPDEQRAHSAGRRVRCRRRICGLVCAHDGGHCVRRVAARRPAMRHHHHILLLPSPPFPPLPVQSAGAAAAGAHGGACDGHTGVGARSAPVLARSRSRGAMEVFVPLRASPLPSQRR